MKLGLVKKMPLSIAVPDDWLDGVVAAIQAQAIQLLGDSEVFKAGQILELTKHLLPDMNITAGFFLSIATAVRTHAVRFIAESNGGKARGTLRLIEQLPANTRFPEFFFFEFVTAIRDWAAQAVKGDEPAKALQPLMLVLKLPPNTSIPGNYFLDAVTSSTASVIAQPAYTTRVPAIHPSFAWLDPNGRRT